LKVLKGKGSRWHPSYVEKRNQKQREVLEGGSESSMSQAWRKVSLAKEEKKLERRWRKGGVKAGTRRLTRGSQGSNIEGVRSEESGRKIYREDRLAGQKRAE